MKSLLLTLALLTAPAHALESAPVRSARAVVTMVTDTDQAAPGTPLRAGLRMRLAPGWHTYWQNPGDAGVAPELNLAPGPIAGPIQWPVPEKVQEGPLTTFAYTGEVLLPLSVTTQGAAMLQAHASWLVCANVCVPEEGDFTLDLPGGTPAPSAEAPLFDAVRLPTPSPYKAAIAPDGTLSIFADPALIESVRNATFFPSDPAIDPGAPQPMVKQGGTLRLALKATSPLDPKGLAGLLMLTDASGTVSALDIAATPGPASTGQSLPQLLLLALAGGLILNLMPCVFPILAMKAMGIAHLSGQGRAAIRAHALSYTAGVMLAFMALGGGLLALRWGGQAAGWGFQFQSPVFVVLTAWLLFGVGLNLSGVFAVGGGVAGAGQSWAQRGGHGGSFFTGLLAVVVATPCTAPFMGAAIAGALAAPPGVTVLIFAAMGLGLAAPYALLSVAPGLARALPRPGAWMDVLKEALAFPMYAAGVWLVWVVSQQAGPDGVLVALSGLALLGFAGWALGRAQRGGGRIGRGAALAGVIAAGLLLPTLTSVPSTDSTERFTTARLAQLRAEGRPVFVNMTAAWCVSCLVNERVALGTDAVQAGFRAHDVAYLKGDWTQQDPGISAFLREQGRDGVPLYVVYLPGQSPQVLPQILTPTLVLAAVSRTSSPPL